MPVQTPTAADPLAAFSPATATWFAEVFAEPTAAQAGAWQAISSGQNALVIAPTGSGKTLAAFLSALDALIRDPHPSAKQRCRVLYVSPLKALAVDVERNLRAPLAGITQTALRLGQTPPSISVGVRSGDTSAGDRRKIVSRPPDILITTPESLFLMLTSAARDVLRHVETVIVDEVHALAGTKRGAHLALSLERLDALVAEQAESEAGAADERDESPTLPADRVVRDRPAPGAGGPLSRRGPPGDGGGAAGVQVLGSLGGRAGGGHGRPGVHGLDAHPRPGQQRGTATPAVDLAARREQDPRPDQRPSLHHRVRELPPAGRAADGPPQRAAGRAGRGGPRRRAPRRRRLRGPTDSGPTGSPAIPHRPRSWRSRGRAPATTAARGRASSPGPTTVR